MIIYITFMLLMVGITLLYDVTKKKYFFYCTTIGLSLFMGLRYYVGTDFRAYNNFFMKAKDINLVEYPKDKGFLLVSQIISEVTTNTRVHFIIFACIINYFIMKVIFEYSEIKAMSVLIYLGLGFYFSAFNIMRQYVAIAIILYSFKFIKENKNLKYYVGVLIATTFHYTAFFLLPLKFILDQKWTYKMYIVISGIGIMMYLNINKIVGLLEESERFSGYSDGYFVEVGANPMFLVVYITIFIFCIYSLGKSGLDDIYVKSLFLGLVFLLMGTKGLIFNRIADYLVILSILIIPEALIRLKSEVRIAGYAIIVCMIFYMSIFVVNNGNLIPYKVI